MSLHSWSKISSNHSFHCLSLHLHAEALCITFMFEQLLNAAFALYCSYWCYRFTTTLSHYVMIPFFNHHATPWVLGVFWLTQKTVKHVTNWLILYRALATIGRTEVMSSLLFPENLGVLTTQEEFTFYSYTERMSHCCPQTEYQFLPCTQIVFICQLHIFTHIDADQTLWRLYYVVRCWCLSSWADLS